MAPRNEQGFTLIELLVSITILGIIGTALIGTLFIAYKTSSETQTMLNESNDREGVSYWFTRDVQNAPSVLTTATACEPAGNALVVRFQWTETPVASPAGSANVAREVVYSTTPVAAGSISLTRSICVAAAARVDVTVASFVTAASTQCLTSAYVVDVTCSAATRVVRLSLTPSSGAAAYTVDGARRPA